ncbi:ABC transporter ATP-binding protein [Salinadaptatus halalkaliphilus]|uniref:ABC transporter ATP-binding protein n=1 Tax=Salinadaptatus halalkaliphilus TaxID=2419781 RepID=A0A4S3TKX4_9EURY|nr:ABC transporter ATP-binding protein [Salinadaptatus halalkaliphilus]THE63238.1 ABC transporter ATP-binding protein [Salinadaptatus halalkaliphilus]
MGAIRTTGLTKRYDGVLAVDGLDLRVERGEVFGFLGPNGAGKSTVINLVLDFVRPTAGSATVLGYDSRTETTAIRRNTGIVPEGATLYERLTGREHLAWIARANGVEADVPALLDRVGLTIDDADRRVGGYSKGMGRRLALAMALVGDPELLILDEPSSGLDPAGIREFREIVREEAADGRTVFFSSHVLGQVEAVADRIGILNRGKLVATGTPAELRGSCGITQSIRFEVTTVPTLDALNAVDGVETTSVDDGVSPSDGSIIEVGVTDAAAKIEVATWLAERTRVRDVVSEERSLETLFDAYTSTARSEQSNARTNGQSGKQNGTWANVQQLRDLEEVEA